MGEQLATVLQAVRRWKMPGRRSRAIHFLADTFGQVVGQQTYCEVEKAMRDWNFGVEKTNHGFALSNCGLGLIHLVLAYNVYWCQVRHGWKLYEAGSMTRCGRWSEEGQEICAKNRT